MSGSSRKGILLAALAAALAKLIVAALTSGTNDADAFYNFGKFIWEHGLLAQYRASAEFNHTPLTGWFCALAYGVGHGMGFNFLLRLPGIAADFATVMLLQRWNEERPAASAPLFPAWALLLFALSPVNFMVSGFHGNVDGVLAWLLLLAARECAQEHGSGHAIRCGLWLGLACQVKIIPLLVAPVFFFFWLARGAKPARAFFGAAAAVILIGWAPALIPIPQIFLSHVLGYSSNWGSWGVTYCLSKTGVASLAPVGFDGLTEIQRAIMSGLKAVIVAASLFLAWRRRTAPGAQVACTLAMAWAVFFVFAPGVGAQYLVWFAPVMLLSSPGWFAAMTAAGTVFLFVFYNTICGGLPWFRGVSTAELVPAWAGWSLAPWAVMAAFLVAIVSRERCFRAST